MNKFNCLIMFLIVTIIFSLAYVFGFSRGEDKNINQHVAGYERCIKDEKLRVLSTNTTIFKYKNIPKKVYGIVSKKDGYLVTIQESKDQYSLNYFKHFDIDIVEYILKD